MNIKEFGDFLGDFDFEAPENFTRFDWFRHSLLRAWTLLVLQDVLTDIGGDKNGLEYEETNEDKSTALEIMKSMEEFPKEIERNKEKIKKKIEEMDKEDREKIYEILMKFSEGLEHLIKIAISLKMVKESPLYPEAVVSGVTTFETFLKDSIVSLVSEHPEIEKRFTPELKEWVTYDKLKEFDYDREKTIGLIVADKINFYDMEEVDEYFRRAFGKKDVKRWSIFPSKKSRQKIQNYIYLRHLIVHKGGIVDSKFKKNTHCKEEIGEEYVIESDYIEGILKEMFQVGAKIWKCMEMMKEKGECK